MSKRLQKRVVLAYSAMETRELNDYRLAIQSHYPDIELRIERFSTNALLDRLLAEGHDGRWDVIFGMALTAMINPVLVENFQVLSIPGLETLPICARDLRNRWFCPSAFVPTFCVNLQRLASRHLPIPTSWSDLADDRFWGEVCLPSPNASGAGYLHLMALLSSAGESEGWRLLKRVAKNVVRIETSALAPGLAALNGEVSVGVTVSTASGRLSHENPFLTTVFPTDAAGIEPEGFALRRNSHHISDANRVLEWMLLPEAHTIYLRYHKKSYLPLTSDDSVVNNRTFFTIDVNRASTSRVENCRLWTRTFMPQQESDLLCCKH